MNYKLIDSGNGRKLERFGLYRLARSCIAATWRARENLLGRDFAPRVGGAWNPAT